MVAIMKDPKVDEGMGLEFLFSDRTRAAYNAVQHSIEALAIGQLYMSLYQNA